MARSSKAEPIEKFRFKVMFLSLSNSVFSKNDGQSFAAFSSIDPPKASVNVMEYRENQGMNRSTKQPGLVSYEPVALRKGVTTSLSLYNWYKEVHNDVVDPGIMTSVVAGANIVPVHSPHYRREMLISSLDREGKGVKHWLCFNCFPVGYKGGDSLDASDSGKLIQELTITYESFIELKGRTIAEVMQNWKDQADEALVDAIEAAAIGAALGTLGSFF